MSKLSVVLWLWGDQPNRWPGQVSYGPAHVNALARKLKQHLRIPHEVVCFNDLEGRGLDPDIRPEPIWPCPVNQGAGCWRRLACFMAGFGRIVGPRYVSMDLDCMVVGDLTPLFERDEPLVLWASGSAPGTPYNMSMWLHTAGTYTQVYDTFDPELSPGIVKAHRLTGTDQAWLSHVLGPDMPKWSPVGHGVYHARLHCRASLPPNARVVFFPGSFKPAAMRDVPWVAQELRGMAA